MRAAAPRSGPPRSEGRPGRSAPVVHRASRACRRRAAVERRHVRRHGHRNLGRRPWTRASAPHHAQAAPLRPRRRATRACAPHRARAGPTRLRHRATRACAPHHAAAARHRPRPWTRACAHHPAPDGPGRPRHRATRACARRPAPHGPRSIHERRSSAHRRVGLAGHQRIPAHTAAWTRRARERSATIRGPGPRAGCLDRMSRSLCSCRPRRPDDVCGVVGLPKSPTRLTGEATPGQPRPGPTRHPAPRIGTARRWCRWEISSETARHPKPQDDGITLRRSATLRVQTEMPPPTVPARHREAVLTQKGPPHDVRRASPFVLKLSPAVSYSPTGSPLQYHRR